MLFSYVVCICVPGKAFDSVITVKFPLLVFLDGLAGGVVITSLSSEGVPDNTEKKCVLMLIVV